MNQPALFITPPLLLLESMGSPFSQKKEAASTELKREREETKGVWKPEEDVG